MFGPFERAVAGRYLRARRGERFVSVIAAFSLVGIALGVATLIIVMSVMGGFKTDLLNRILGFNGHLGVYGAGHPITDFDADVAKIKTIPGVVTVIPVVDGKVLISNDHGGNSGAYVRGIRPADLQSLHAVSDHIRGGSIAAFKGSDAIAIGLTLANNFGVTVGDRITLISPEGAATAFGTVPRVKSYIIITTVFQVGMNEYDSGYVFPAARGRTGVLPAAQPGDADRSLGHRPGPRPRHRPATSSPSCRPTRRSKSSTGNRTTTASSPPSRSSRT